MEAHVASVNQQEEFEELSANLLASSTDAEEAASSLGTGLNNKETLLAQIRTAEVSFIDPINMNI